MRLYHWPTTPTHGAEGPLPWTPYAQGLLEGARKNLQEVPYDYYGRPSMYMGPVGPKTVAGVWYRPFTLLGYPRGEYGLVDAYVAQGPLPDPGRPPWRPRPVPTWAELLRRRR